VSMTYEEAIDLFEPLRRGRGLCLECYGDPVCKGSCPRYIEAEYDEDPEVERD
jgi:radical SAM protein with 4Fe4S-binding SPASM domain